MFFFNLLIVTIESEEEIIPEEMTKELESAPPIETEPPTNKSVKSTQPIISYVERAPTSSQTITTSERKLSRNIHIIEAEYVEIDRVDNKENSLERVSVLQSSVKPYIQRTDSQVLLYLAFVQVKFKSISLFIVR